MNRFEFRQQFDGSEDFWTHETAVRYDPEKDRAVQSEKEGTDINVLVRRFGVTGVPGRAGQPFYGDFSEGFDYQASLDTLRQADNAFLDLPSSIRDRFDNSPAKLIRFLQNPENRDEAIKLGLVEVPPPPEPVAPMDVRIVNPEPSPESGEG